jgi:zinc/manganese transport system substrate-binding protein
VRSVGIGLLASILAFASAVPVAGQEASDRPSVIVTTEVLGSLVSELVGDAATVSVLMASGSDPHTWQPSARDSELVFGADFVVANGLGLEEGLLRVLDQAHAEGVPIFQAGDHVGSVTRSSASPAPEPPPPTASPAGPTDEHGHAVGDPHIWLDPLAMRDVVLALRPALAEAGIEVGDRAAILSDELEALDAEVAATLAAIPPERRRLVSGHGALGRFADRYGFEVVGSVVPGLSSADEPSARDIAELVEAIRTAGVSTVFVDATTPRSVADAVAAEAGVRVMPLSVEQLPDPGRYADLLRGVAGAIADGLAE